MHMMLPTTEPLHRPTVRLTKRGDAAVAIIRLADQLLALDAESRVWCLELLQEVVDEAATVA